MAAGEFWKIPLAFLICGQHHSGSRGADKQGVPNACDRCLYAASAGLEEGPAASNMGSAMKKTTSFMAALLAATVLSGAAYAKTLVYCSEASPANFDPGTTTGGNDFDASSRTIYSRLVEFKHGGTEIEPGLADSWDISDDGLT